MLLKEILAEYVPALFSMRDARKYLYQGPMAFLFLIPKLFSVSWMDLYIISLWPSLELVVWNNKHYEKPNCHTVYKANMKMMCDMSLNKAQMVTECQHFNWSFSVDHA